MSETPQFSELSTKDLRQLAGEHQINNRSRLGRDSLIEALSSVLAQRGTAAPAGEAAAAQPALASPAVQPEPEVLDPAAVASLTGDADSEDEGDEDEDGEPIAEGGEPGEGQGIPGQPGEGRRRRRRRRRRRGGQGDPQSEAEAMQAEGQAPVNPGASPGGASTVQPQMRPPQGERRDGQRQEGDRHGGQRRDGERNEGRERQDGQRREGRPEQQPNPNRSPRPRLDGPQRPVPSALDRLCIFTRGVLELCDPSTPTWAQARLSELLAEAGLSPIPCAGPAHPDFHEVVGTVSTDAVPAGHIAVVEVPGFALRGDRGDLFPLRRARVKIVPGREPAPAPVVTPVVTPAVTPVVTPTIREPEVLGPEGVSVDPQPTRPREQARPEDPDAGFLQPARSATAPAEAGPRDRDRRREPRRDEQRHAPRQGGHLNRTVPASVAPVLPLVMQQPEELSARPKAEAFRIFGLNDQILADLAAMGFHQPTPIQTEALPVAISGKDMIGQAQTGTGKTAAFALPLLNRLYQLEGEGPVALVLTPTRELAKQVHDAFCSMAGESGARAALIYGGVSMDDQFDALDRKPHVVIGTPGRIIDHMKRRTLDLSRLAVAVLDEADQMLDIGFWPDVMWIMSHTPPARQTLLFSATFPEPIRVMAEQHMRDPVHVHIKPAQVTVEQVDQKYIAVAHDRKTSLLAHFIETQKPEQLVVFCRTKHQTDRVAEVLKRKNLSAGAIHGDLPQNKRERMLQDFRNRDLQCLIATNVAARGLDIPSISHVVNYDIPENPEEYVHRIGRTARNGARGVARTFITPEDGQFLLEIEKHIGLELEEEEIEGFTTHAKGATEVKRTIAELPASTPRLLKPLVGGIRLGRRR